MVNLAYSVAHKIKYNSSAGAADFCYPSNPILLQMHISIFVMIALSYPCCVWQHIDFHCCIPHTVETKLSVIRSLQEAE